MQLSHLGEKLDVGHRGSWRATGAHPGDEITQLRAQTVGHNLHGAVRAVADSACQLQIDGTLESRGAEEHALDAAVDANGNCMKVGGGQGRNRLDNELGHAGGCGTRGRWGASPEYKGAGVGWRGGRRDRKISFTI